jgi:hypothetical protein
MHSETSAIAVIEMCRSASLSDWSGVRGEIATGVARAARMSACAP